MIGGSTDEMIAVARKSDHRLIGNVYLGKRDCNAREQGYVFNIKQRGFPSLCREREESLFFCYMTCRMVQAVV